MSKEKEINIEDGNVQETVQNENNEQTTQNENTEENQNTDNIAAVDAEQGIIYANPSCGFSEEEWIFVLAHEYLHAGLQHQKRCNGRDFFLWNIACDYVINDWLHEMCIIK